MSDARAGRGKGNCCNSNWFDNPLWDKIGPDARKKQDKPDEVVEEEVVVDNLDDLPLRERIRRLQSLAY